MSFRVLILAAAGSLLANGAVAADAKAGKAYFTDHCTMCHSAEPDDGGGDQGPVLTGLFGRPAASADPGFAYTPALKGAGLTWDAATLDKFLASPAAVAPGTAMGTPVPRQKDRDDLIAYFRQLAAPTLSAFSFTPGRSPD